MADDFLIEMRKEFLSEVWQNIEEVEEAYLALESSSDTTEELSRIFRLMHSIKGGGAVVGLLELSEFAHVVEDLLSILRLHPALVDKSVVSLLLRSGDAIKERISALRVGEEGEWQIEDLKRELAASVEAMGTAVGLGGPEGAVHVPPAAVAKAVAADSPDQAEGEGDSSHDAPTESAPKKAEGIAAEPAKAAIAQGASLKVDAERIDGVLDLLGELVVIKGQLLQQKVITASDDRELSGITAQVDKLVRELYDRTLSLRMTALKPMFRKVQRIVRDLSVRLQKPIELEIRGEGTEIDRVMIDLLSDPLIHLARNSVDHGIEKKEVRAASGKPELARVEVHAYQEGGRVVIEFRDDGGGINPEKVFAKAQQKGLIPPEKKIGEFSKTEIVNMIFAPGFSTAEVVSDVSGRGVGLDVVRSNIEKVGGSVSVESEVGKGSIFRIMIPLTSAITDGMVVGVNGFRYIVPISEVVELVPLKSEMITRVRGQHEVVHIRGRFMPLIRMKDQLPLKFADPTLARELALDPARIASANTIVIIVERRRAAFALEVDSVLMKNQFVIKSLGKYFEQVNGITGASVMGDGKVALILDPEGIIRNFQARQASSEIQTSEMVAEAA